MWFLDVFEVGMMVADLPFIPTVLQERLWMFASCSHYNGLLLFEMGRLVEGNVRSSFVWW
jgi:hypothetical protein